MLATNFEINPDFMLDTLSFSQNMQQAGMAKEIADMLAFNLKNLQINQLENLLTKNEFRIFEKEMRNFQIKMEEFRIEMKDFKQEVKTDIDELKTEMKDFKHEINNKIETMVSKTEFYNEINKLGLILTIKLGTIMVTGLGIIGYLIKF